MLARALFRLLLASRSAHRHNDTRVRWAVYRAGTFDLAWYLGKGKDAYRAMARPFRLIVAAITVSACSSGGPTAIPAESGARMADAGVEASREAGVEGGNEASADAGPACTVPPAANSPRDAAAGCSSSPGLLVNGIDVCTASEYGLGCDNESAPASLGCKDLGLPTPQGVSIYCCPCLP